MRPLARPPEPLSKAVGLLLTDAKLAKVPLTVLSLAQIAFHFLGPQPDDSKRPRYADGDRFMMRWKLRLKCAWS